MRDALQKLYGQNSMLRPNVKTPKEFNAHIDNFCKNLQSIKIAIGPEPESVSTVTVVVDPLGDEEPEAEREEQGGTDRMDRSGHDRKV